MRFSTAVMAQVSGGFEGDLKLKERTNLPDLSISMRDEVYQLVTILAEDEFWSLCECYLLQLRRHCGV